jgi:hypothetical protein
MFGVEAEADERGWGSPPMLLSLHATRSGIIAPRASFPGLPWDGDDTVKMLHRALDRLRYPLKDPITNTLVSGIAVSGWCGYMLVTECWLVTGDADQPVVLMRAAGRRELFQHPERVEVRSVYAMDHTRAPYAVERIRGGTPVTSAGGIGGIESRLADALVAMINVTRSYESVST